ncbi:hypothetical protein RJT34_19540 [Clitoria ternatea]|uniref:Uncharacterized protein n=1 Tax=Clitoria ternatea TaxID=43366 RepID=A0AAN9IR71_CLITE
MLAEAEGIAQSGILVSISGNIIVTGDNWGTANSIAREIGIETVIAEANPDQRAGHVKEFQTSKSLLSSSNFQWQRQVFGEEVSEDKGMHYSGDKHCYFVHKMVLGGHYGVVSAKKHGVFRRGVFVAFVALFVPPAPKAFGSLDEEEGGCVVAGYGGKVEFSVDWDSPVGAGGGEVDGELVRGDPDLLAQKGKELVEIERGIDDDLIDVGLSLAVEVDDGEGYASAVDHVVPMDR